MNDEELAKHLENWFKIKQETLNTSKNIWARNKVAKILKDNLKELSHWKNKSKNRKSNLIQLEAARKKKNEIKIIKQLNDW